jgi:hypothetical protein
MACMMKEQFPMERKTKILGPKFNLVPGVSFAKISLAQDFDLMPYTTVAENVGKFNQWF